MYRVGSSLRSWTYQVRLRKINAVYGASVATLLCGQYVIVPQSTGRRFQSAKEIECILHRGISIMAHAGT